MDGNIFNSQGVHVATVLGPSIYDLRGRKLYDLKGTKIYKLSGELAGHLADMRASERHLDRATDRAFSSLLICLKTHTFRRAFVRPPLLSPSGCAWLAAGLGDQQNANSGNRGAMRRAGRLRGISARSFRAPR
jgi:hypothetical protein